MQLLKFKNDINKLKKGKQINEPPHSLAQAFIQFIWASKLRSFYLISAIVLFLCYLIWNSLPDSSKQNIINHFFWRNIKEAAIEKKHANGPQKTHVPAHIIVRGIGAEILKTKIDYLNQYLSKIEEGNIQIDLAYSDQIQNVNGNLWYYPGGALIIKVNGTQCFNSLNLTIPRTEPFGNPRVDVEQQIIKNVENLLRQHLSQIIQTIESCI
jgi:hypothetical protein